MTDQGEAVDGPGLTIANRSPDDPTRSSGLTIDVREAVSRVKKSGNRALPLSILVTCAVAIVGGVPQIIRAAVEAKLPPAHVTGMAVVAILALVSLAMVVVVLFYRADRAKDEEPSPRRNGRSVRAE